MSTMDSNRFVYTAATAGPAWFCVRTQLKREHIAASWLRSRFEMEVFLPRIRFRRTQPRGLVWFTEALFPTYVFARFDLGGLMQQVDKAPGVRGVVRFGPHCPSVPDQVIEALQAGVGPDDVRVVKEGFQPGETVRMAGGVFHGLEAVVERVLPARERVVVLLEFLGRQTMVEVEASGVNRIKDLRTEFFGNANEC
jgi:transcriptional antiterminator RfaH